MHINHNLWYNAYGLVGVVPIVVNFMESTQSFTIGAYSFETFHEFRNAQEDLRKIELINEELDIHDSEVALRLYNNIREGKIVFRSPIGEQFASHIADIVADRSADLIEDIAVAEEAESRFRYQRFMGVAAISIAIILAAYFGIHQLMENIHTKKLEQMAEQARQEAILAEKEAAEKREAQEVFAGVIGDGAYTAALASAESEALAAQAADIATEEEPFLIASVEPDILSVLPEYENLNAQNSDFAGWLTIPGTNIDYPVLQTTDNDYYLTKDFDKNSNSNGSLFVDYRSDILNSTTNTIIYGHNMKSGAMFGGLKYFLDEGYFNDHRVLTFNTKYQHRQYEILAVGLSEVSYQDEDDYRYYDFIHAENQEQWQEFVDNVGSKAIYGSLDALRPTDKILTLSTCNDYTEDGRLFIIARMIKDPMMEGITQ